MKAPKKIPLLPLFALSVALLRACALSSPAQAQAAPPAFRPAPGPAGSVVVNVKSPPAFFRAAAGDGVTDDTAALQALITYGEAHAGGWVYLPGGTYRITAPLVLCNPGPSGSYTSVLLRGDGPGSQAAPGQPGTTIVMAAAGQDCLLNVAAGTAAHPGQLYNCRVEDIYLSGHTTAGAADTTFGIHWTGTGFNAWRCQGVQVDHCRSFAFQVDAASSGVVPFVGAQPSSLPTSLNGENGVLDQCRSNYCPFFCRTAGQAYGWAIRDCQCSDNLPGAMIKDGYTANGNYGGFGLIVENFSASFGTNNAGNIAFDVGGINENAVFERCRVEHVGEFLRLQGGSVGYLGHVTVRDCTFTDLSVGGGNLLHRASVNAQPFVRITDCNFQSPDGPSNAPYPKSLTWPTRGADYGHYVVEGCTFSGYKTVRLNASAPGTNATYPAAGLVVKDCWMNMPGPNFPLIAVPNK